ncbi:MAG: hypothetical protein KDG57_19115 [Rhodoferax sp.]|nr:hypothetical protein [Rhodoferax sp.]
MTTGPSARLTWHQGSVLPYSSLWHTVQRVMSLNALRPKELAFCGRGSDEVGVPRHVNLLYNETGDGLRGTPVEALSMRSLAQALGESEAVFAWAHLGGLPRSVRSLISPSVRVCRTCMAAGYHSALHSLRLLQTCPIHGDELADRCNCGEPFADDQVVLHHMNAGYCRCGRMAFFTSQTCRRPTMRHEETAPMSMVATWLERLAGVIRPSPGDHKAQRAHDRILLDSVGGWCAELNLGNPGSAIAPDLKPLRASISVTRLSSIECEDTVRPATHSRDRAASTRGKHSLYWTSDDATTTYRSLARHIRRHVARGAEAHAIDFMLNPDPLQMGARMRARRQAMVAFADLLFTECMETYAGLRRWPYRDPREDATSWARDGLAPLSFEGGHDWPQTLRDARLAWVRRQAAAAAITHAWRRAQMLAVHAAATGFADWSAATERYLPAGAISSAHIDRPKPSGTAFWFDAPPPYQATWAAVVSGEYLRFVSAPAMPRIDWTLPRSSKAQRQATWSEAERRRASALRGACGGPCLSWSAHAGWAVLPSAFPATALSKRHRLLGVAGAPRFWVFALAGGFAARMCEIRIQAFGATAREAIDALRSAVRQHSRRCPEVNAVPPLPSSDPEPLPPEVHAEYELRVSRELHAHGFWRRPWMFGNIAREHLASVQGRSGDQP